MNEVTKSICKLIIIVTKFTRYSNNDVINSALDSVLDDYYYKKDENVIIVSVGNLYEVIVKFGDFTAEQIKEIQDCVDSVRFTVMSNRAVFLTSRQSGKSMLSAKIIRKHMIELSTNLDIKKLSIK